MPATHEAWLAEGIAAARAGEVDRAQTCLRRVIEADGRNLQAWYWLSRVADSPDEQKTCLENVLAIDPGHMAVQARLAELRDQLAERGQPSRTTGNVGEAPVPRTPVEMRISEAAIEPLLCPYCGAVTGTEDRRCDACDGGLYVRRPRKRDHSVYSLGLVIAWFSLANYVWLALTVYYLLSGLSVAVDASPGVRSTLQVLGRLLGVEQGQNPLADLPLAPMLLLGVGISFTSLVVAWGLYRRLRLFYALTVGLVLLYPLAIVYQIAIAEAIPWGGLAIQVLVFLLTLGLAFMAYEEFAWDERRLSAGVDKDVDSHSALYARGREHAALGMWAKAAAHWSKAVALSPGHADYRIALASACINLNQPERAQEHLHEAQRIEPENPQVRHLLESLPS
jgi:tetratricopeptide (TPR) repeat protein